jgi:hypothetical protein
MFHVKHQSRHYVAGFAFYRITLYVVITLKSGYRTGVHRSDIMQKSKTGNFVCFALAIILRLI